MRFNKKFDLDFPEEVFDYDNNLITYKTSTGEFRYKNEIRKYKKKNINPTIHDNTIPISGYEICGFNNTCGTRGGQGRTTVTIKHPITGHKFVMTADNFYIDVINKLEIKNGVIQSKCFLGFDRYERLFPIRLIIENDPLILGASLELTTKKPSSPNKLVIGARCKSKNYGEVIYVGPISNGALVEADFDGASYSYKMNIYKKTSTRLYLFQKCNDPDTLCLETWIGQGTIEKIIDPNAGTNLSIDTIKQSILSEDNCKFDHIEPIRDNSKAEKYTITYRGTAYYDHKLFMYQESPKKIIIVQRLRATYCDGKTVEKYLLRGEVICDAAGNEVRLNPYESKNGCISSPDYCISLTTGPKRLHNVFDEFTGDIQKLVPIRSNAHLGSGYSYRTDLDISDLHPCIRILDKQGKEIPHFDDIRVNNGNKLEINANIL